MDLAMTNVERDAAVQLRKAIAWAKRAQGEELARAQASVAYWKETLLQASEQAMQQGAA